MDFSADQIAKYLIGAGFTVYAFDGNKPWWARLGYGAVGAFTLYSAYNNSPLLGLGKPPVGAQRSGLVFDPSSTSAESPLKFQEHRVKTITERVAYVHKQMVLGTRDPAVYTLAREILSRRNWDGSWKVAEKDNVGEATALFNEVKKRVRYTLDPVDFDAFQTPRRTLDLNTGDCDDYTSLLGAMLRSVGINVKSRVVQTQGNSTWNHIYLVAVMPNGKEMSLDLAVSAPAGWEVPAKLVIKKQDFEVKEEGPPTSQLLKLQATNGIGANFGMGM